MQTTINGTSHAFTSEQTINEWLDSLQVDARQVAVEKNGTIIPASAFGSTHLQDGDTVELVEFVGGG